jgi:ferric-dicitrate binding protein FerR (iron transport regulator)
MNICFRSAGALLLVGCLWLLSLGEACAQANRGGAAPLDRLPEELRDLSPSDYFIPSSQEKVGVIHRLEGNVVIVHGTGKEAYFGMQGDPVYEKDTLVTLAQSVCSIHLLDGDTVTMASETEFTLESFEERREEGRKSSFIKMAKGRAMFFAMRLFSYKDGRFTVATPTNTVGVRGTEFGIHSYFLDDRKSVTDCFCEEGVVDVDGLTVASGQMYSGRTGQVIPTPADAIRSFRNEMEFKTETQTERSSGLLGASPPDRPIPPPIHVPPVRPVTPPSSVTPPRPPTPPPATHMHH